MTRIVQLFSICALIVFLGVVKLSGIAYCREIFAGTESDRGLALEIAENDPRVKDIATDFPEIRLIPAFLEQYNVWVIEFVLHGREVGMASVSLEDRRVVEFEFSNPHETEFDEIRKRDEREEKRVSTWSSLVRSILPTSERTALLWVTLLLSFLLVADFDHILRWRHLDVMILFAMYPFIEIIWQHTKVAYTGIFFVTLYLFVRPVICVYFRASASLGGAFASWKPVALILAVFLGWTFALFRCPFRGHELSAVPCL